MRLTSGLSDAVVCHQLCKWNTDRSVTRYDGKAWIASQGFYDVCSLNVSDICVEENSSSCLSLSHNIDYGTTI